MKLSDVKVGQTIYGTPWGNEARYGRAGRVEKFEVVKKGRKYATLLQNDYTYSNQWDLESGRVVKGDCNGGYTFYSSKQEIQDAREVNQLRIEIRGLCDHWSSDRLMKVPKASLIEIKRLLTEGIE